MCDRVEQALTCDPQNAACHGAGDGGCFATHLDRDLEGLRQRPLRESVERCGQVLLVMGRRAEYVDGRPQLMDRGTCEPRRAAELLV
jgi:hypothetical protein